MRRAVLLGALLAAMVAVVVAPALAAPVLAADGPPETVLSKGERNLQKGRLGSYCWSYPDGNGGGFSECSDVAGYSYPKPDRVAPGSGLRVRIFEAQKPDTFTIHAYRKVGRWGFPVGEGRQLNATLTPVVENGETVAWDASFRANQPGRDYFLDAFGVWEGKGDAGYAFHFKTRDL